jgi:hypothetical protein
VCRSLLPVVTCTCRHVGPLVLPLYVVLYLSPYMLHVPACNSDRATLSTTPKKQDTTPPKTRNASSEEASVLLNIYMYQFLQYNLSTTPSTNNCQDYCNK